jgi:hypothetical protein
LRCQPGGRQDRDRQRGSGGKNIGSTFVRTPGKKTSNIVIFTVLGAAAALTPVPAWPLAALAGRLGETD